jgi:hypothetical protein
MKASTQSSDDAWLTHPLAVELDRLTDADPPITRAEAAFRAYTADTGQPLSSPPTAQQRDQVRRWMLDLFVEYPLLTVMRKPIWQERVYRDVAAKASSLQQATCTQCHVIDPAGKPPYPCSFPIPVRPFSKQVPTAGELTRAVKTAISESVHTNDIESWRGVAICATVVSVQDKAENIIDVDNAAKTILDTMERLIFPNDQKIQHLSVSRLTAPDTTGYYLICLRPVHDALDDVVALTSNATLAGTIRPVTWPNGQPPVLS